jgi:hypothetical protein
MNDGAIEIMKNETSYGAIPTTVAHKAGNGQDRTNFTKPGENWRCLSLPGVLSDNLPVCGMLANRDPGGNLLDFGSPSTTVKH